MQTWVKNAGLLPSFSPGPWGDEGIWLDVDNGDFTSLSTGLWEVGCDPLQWLFSGVGEAGPGDVLGQWLAVCFAASGKRDWVDVTASGEGEEGLWGESCESGVKGEGDIGERGLLHGEWSGRPGLRGSGNVGDPGEEGNSSLVLVRGILLTWT